MSTAQHNKTTRSIDHINSIKNYDRIYDRSLFLAGVYKKDYKKIEELFQERIISEISKQSDKNYDKIPPIFNNLDKWIKQTNLCCWHCCNKIKGVPVFLPKNIEPKNNGIVGFAPGSVDPEDMQGASASAKSKYYNILTEGAFCSFNCAQAYLDDIYSKNMPEYINRMNMLLFLYNLFNDKTVDYIKPSPPKYKMQQYGGTMTTSEYEEEIKGLDDIWEKEYEETNLRSIYEKIIIGL
jgi:hypothetical protein